MGMLVLAARCTTAVNECSTNKCLSSGVSQASPWTTVTPGKIEYNYIKDGC